jgi:hypothetical protein
LSYYGNGNHFQAMKRSGSLFPARPVNAVGSRQHDDRRGKRKRAPGGNGTGNAAAHHPDRVTDLTARWSRQEIAERHKIRKGLLSQPLATFHKFLSKIAEVRDRTSERGQTQPEEDHKRFQNRLAKTSRSRFHFALLYLTDHGRNPVQRLDLERLNVFKESHEAEIHVKVLMAVKQGESGIISDKTDLNPAETFNKDRVF